MIEMPSRILVCGGRDFKDRSYVFKALDNLQQWFAIDFVIIEGGANGVDWLSKEWAHSNGHACIEMKAAWDFYDKDAGHIRNGWMIKFAKPDLVIAFPGGSGTADMIKQAKRAGITVYES